MYGNLSANYWKRSLVTELPYTIELSNTSVGALLLQDFRSHVRVTDTGEDRDLMRYLDTAARAWEDDTRRCLLNTTVKEYYDVWPWDHIYALHLHRAPVSSITSITYYDDDGNQQTWDSGDYVADIVNEPARIIEADNPAVSSPNLDDDRPNCVTIEYVAGFGSDIEDLEPAAINAIFVKASYLYGCGRELMFTADETAVERCWQSSIRHYMWSA